VSAPSPLSLRPATPDDIPAITAIYGPNVAEGIASFEYEVPDDAEMGRRQAAVLAAGYPYLVAEIDGTVAGDAYASAYRARELGLCGAVGPGQGRRQGAADPSHR
jgi:L-amino acid N-acyltransferase YncA